MSTKEILNSRQALEALISSEERHNLSDFLYQVRDDLKAGAVTAEDFWQFKNGDALTMVLNLKTPETQARLGRPLGRAEIADKIKYLSLVPNIQSLNNIFTDSRLINGLMVDDFDLSYWFTGGGMHEMPLETRTNITFELVKLGMNDKAGRVLSSMKADFERKHSAEHDQR